jgi:hypothetical protein
MAAPVGWSLHVAESCRHRQSWYPITSVVSPAYMPKMEAAEADTVAAIAGPATTAMIVVRTRVVSRATIAPAFEQSIQSFTNLELLWVLWR